jgi:hypothetical protein
MTTLHWPLSVLSRCIDYKNLTAASKHVGLSQPQLSRLIKQVETELEVVLLDRSSPRHSTWTPQARAVASIYKQSETSLDSKLSEYLDESFQKEIKIGCLEGLSDLAKSSANKVLTGTRVTTVTLNIYDLNRLETKFLAGELDLIFTSREPSRKKYEKIKVLGYQTLSKTKNSENSDLHILSPFEEQLFKAKKKNLKKLISNSLAIRLGFQTKYGGISTVPSKVQKSEPLKDGIPVLLIGQDALSKEVWNC